MCDYIESCSEKYFMCVRVEMGCIIQCNPFTMDHVNSGHHSNEDSAYCTHLDVAGTVSTVLNREVSLFQR